MAGTRRLTPTSPLTILNLFHHFPISESGHIQVPDIVTVDQDGAGVDVEEALQELDARGLTATGGAHQSDGLAPLHFKVDPAQNLKQSLSCANYTLRGCEVSALTFQ